MSDQHSVEDEIVAEARKFSAAMRAAIQRHAQAANWLERRRASKEISRLVRQERRDQDQIRGHHLSGANQAVDRYRIHAQAVAQRANDPRVDHERRARDARALAQHRQDLGKQFVTDPYLTRTEQGIVLDGLDAATVFPEFRTGNLFARAHKVKGLEALRFRARVARETVAINERAAAERAQWQQEGLDHTRRANAEEAVLARINAAQTHRRRYRAEMTWSHPDGGALTESRDFATEHVATDWMKANISRAAWNDGTTLHVQTIDGHNGAVQYSDFGRPEAVADQLAVRKSVLRERTLAGLVHREQVLAAEREAEGRERTAQQEREPEAQEPEADLRFSARVSYLPEGADRVVYEYGDHASEAATAAWVQQQVAQARPAPGTTVHVAAYADSGEGHPDPVFRAVARREEVAEDVAQWRIDIANVAADREQNTDRTDPAEREARQAASTATRSAPDWAQGVAGQINELADQRDASLAQTKQLTQIAEKLGAERNQLRGELDSLTQRHQLSIEHNGKLTDRVAKLERQLTALIAERDQAITDRDAAVRKVVEMTPAQQRYGSAERQADQARAESMAETSQEQGGPSALADYQQGSTLAEAVTHGSERNGAER
ncbi:hypothetical protein [Nocardia xishanensis]|uniref:Uncharacterized protein n=1 Tax=Nocardia xishanensis TaxID=238964 RepID=A0ABW7WYG1_9NOCA